MACCGSKGHLAAAVISMVLALGLGVLAAITDHWFIVATRDLERPEVMKATSFHFGFWLKCFNDPPNTYQQDELMSEVVGEGDKCLEIYRDLINPKDNQSSTEETVLALSRAYVLLALIFIGAQLSVLVTMVCCCCPCGRSHFKRAGVCCLAAVVQLVTSCAGVGCAICFLAARELEMSELKLYAHLDTAWGWSFVLMWAAAGCALLANFLLVCLVKYTPDTYSDLSKDEKGEKFYYHHSHEHLGDVIKAYWTEDGQVF